MNSNTQSNHVELCLCAALNCEAKALVDRMQLKKVSDKPFGLFKGSAELGRRLISVRLVISGIGALNMASAVAWMAASSEAESSVWLNVGIAGHGGLSIGDGFIVSSSQDVFSKKPFFPPQVASRPVPTSRCMSLNAPSTDYPEEGCIDMESAAFYHSALKFANAECVQAFKVVSDTPDHSPENLNAKTIDGFMQAHTDSILAFADNLVVLAASMPQSVNTLTLPKVRASHSQQQQLDDMAMRLNHMLDESKLLTLNTELGSCTDISSVLALLREHLSVLQPELAKLKHG